MPEKKSRSARGGVYNPGTGYLVQTQDVSVYSAQKGTSGAHPVTARAVDANTGALAVFEEHLTPTGVSGAVTAAAAGAVVADTGALAAGTYRVEIAMGYSGTLAAGKHVSCEHRNAANGATLATLALVPAGDSGAFVIPKLVVALNERVRVVTGIISAAAEVAQASIRTTLLP